MKLSLSITAIAALICLTTASVAGQATKPVESKPVEPKATLSPAEQIDLQIRLLDLSDAKAQAEIDLASARVQLRALSAVVDSLLAESAQPRIKEADAQRKALAEKLIVAFGGDPAKGDTWDWKTRTITKGGGQ